MLAAVHAGWRGTAAGAVPAALAAMRDRGARPERVVAFVGPAVHPARYQVSDDVQPARWPMPCAPPPLGPAVARPDGPGHWLVDLDAANRQQLLAGGICAEHIVGSDATTDDDPYFSDRAQRPCGRFGLLAAARRTETGTRPAAP